LSGQKHKEGPFPHLRKTNQTKFHGVVMSPA
jgi:hypothetical protein